MTTEVVSFGTMQEVCYGQKKGKKRKKEEKEMLRKIQKEER